MTPPTPEELARARIDELLIRCGWVLQDMVGANLHAAQIKLMRELVLNQCWVDWIVWEAHDAKHDQY